MKVKIKRKEQILYLCDFKTGKYKEPRFQDYSQLLYYAIHFFEKYKLPKIVISFIYVEHNLENDLELEYKYLNNYKRDLLMSIKEIEDETAFNPNFSKLCDYCGFKELCDSER